jgi:adenylate cyclase
MLALIVVAGALAAQRWLRPAATDGRSQDEPPSIAVLPFTNMSGDPEQEYFADGISETLITILSKLPSLVVIARNSTFAYKGKSEDVRQIGKDLGVRYVLEGSFQKSRDAVRVSAQLIDAMNGKHLWAENYDRSLNDIFAIQDEITKQIVSQMDAKFIAGTDASANQTSTKSAKAYELFLKANQLYYQRTKESFAEARKTLEDSLAIDPRYAAAFDLLGEIHMDQAWERWGPSTEESFQLAKSNFESALEADPNFAQAVADLGWYYWFVEHDFERGKSLAAKSVALDPGSANSHDILGAILLWTGQPERALRELQLALKLNPTPYPVRLKDLGWAYFVNGRYEEALQFGQRAHAMAPQETATLRLLVLTHVELGQVDEAHRFVQLLMQEMPYFSLAWYERNILPIIQTEALRNRLLNGLRKAGVPEK